MFYVCYVKDSKVSNFFSLPIEVHNHRNVYERYLFNELKKERILLKDFLQILNPTAETAGSFSLKKLF